MHACSELFVHAASDSRRHQHHGMLEHHDWMAVKSLDSKPLYLCCTITSHNMYSSLCAVPCMHGQRSVVINGCNWNVDSSDALNKKKEWQESQLYSPSYKVLYPGNAQTCVFDGQTQDIKPARGAADVLGISCIYIVFEVYGTLCNGATVVCSLTCRLHQWYQWHDRMSKISLDQG